MGALANVRGGGSAKEWDDMNDRNKRMFDEWKRISNDKRVNVDKQIGLPMVEIMY